MNASPLRRARRRVTRPIVAAAGWLLPWPYRLYIGFVFRTSRVTRPGEEAFVDAAEAARGGVLAYYHENLFVAPYAMRRHKLVSLTSRVDAGTLVAGTLKHFGYLVVRTRKRDDRGTLRDLLDTLRANPGYCLGLAVDGPSGPRRIAKPGAAFVARRLNVPVFVVHAGFAHAIKYPAWDRCRIPLPFNRIVLRFDPVPVSHAGTHAVAELPQRIQAQLDRTVADATAEARSRSARRPPRSAGEHCSPSP